MRRTANDVIAEIAEEEKAERLSELESAVIEAAIKLRRDGFWHLTISHGQEFCDAVDALIKSRSEATGVLKDEVVSEDRERVPREETI